MSGGCGSWSGRFQRTGVTRIDMDRNATIWLIVGVLLIIALLMWIIPRLG